MRHFLSLSDLSVSEIDALLVQAAQFERAPIADVLRNRVVGLLFFNDSLRTLASMQAGIAQLGGSSFVVQPGSGSWKLETEDGAVMDGDRPEHIREAIPVLGRYADILGIRKFAEGGSLADDLADPWVARMCDLAGKPTMNLESAADHPCQALADWKTLDDLGIPRDGGRFVLSWAWHPKPLPYAVPRAALRMAAQRGMEVTVLHPPGFALPDAMMAEAEALGAGSVRATTDRREAFAGAHAVYVKSWAAPQAYGDPAMDAALRESLRDWCVDEPWFATARPDAKFMHCLPVRRNVKVTDAVLDGPRSVVLRQAENRLHVQKAVLASLAEELR